MKKTTLKQLKYSNFYLLPILPFDNSNNLFSRFFFLQQILVLTQIIRFFIK